MKSERGQSRRTNVAGASAPPLAILILCDFVVFFHAQILLYWPASGQRFDVACSYLVLANEESPSWTPLRPTEDYADYDFARIGNFNFPYRRHAWPLFFRPFPLETDFADALHLIPPSLRALCRMGHFLILRRKLLGRSVCRSRLAQSWIYSRAQSLIGVRRTKLTRKGNLACCRQMMIVALCAVASCDWDFLLSHHPCLVSKGLRTSVTSRRISTPRKQTPIGLVGFIATVRYYS